MKSKISGLRDGKEGYSIEGLTQKIAEKEHLLMTSSKLDKRDEAKLSNEINELKRALHEARPSI